MIHTLNERSNQKGTIPDTGIMTARGTKPILPVAFKSDDVETQT